MTLQWTTPTTPAFDTQATGANVNATKDLGGGNSVQMSFHISFGGEGPTPSESAFLGYLGVLYNALEADGWTADLRFQQTASSYRYIESV